MGLPALTSHQSERLREGIGLFNRGQFFECHEVLEAAWLEASAEWKTFLQGLIQVAVAFHHLRQGNFLGAQRLLRAGIEKLSRGATPQEIVDLEPLLAALEPLPERIGANQVRPDWLTPQIRLRLPPDCSAE